MEIRGLYLEYIYKPLTSYVIHNLLLSPITTYTTYTCAHTQAQLAEVHVAPTILLQR